MSDIRTILLRTETIAVVGFSTHPEKAAHRIPALLKRAGYRVIPVHPWADEILGEKAYRTLADVPDEIDTVVLFRPSRDCAKFAAEAVDVGAKAVWLQLGLYSAAAREICELAGIGFVEDTCTKIVARDHAISKVPS